MLIAPCVQSAEAPLIMNGGDVDSFSHQLFYSYDKRTLDFDQRGHVDFKSQSVGARLAFGINEDLTVAVNGGLLVSPTLENSQSTWRGRSGYFFGTEFLAPVFPATKVWPGILVKGSVQSESVFVDRQESAGVTNSADQRLTDIRYGGAVIASWKWAQYTPYVGPEVYGGDIRWTDNRAIGLSPARIKGNPKNPAGLIFGLSVNLFKELSAQIEGRVFSETSIKATINWFKY